MGAGGVYAGYHPADSTQAIAHLETLRARGAGFWLIPATSFWWLDYYADFRRYLESQFRLLTYSQGTCVIYALDAPLAAEKHRSRAADLGVDAFIGKPYQEAELLQHIRACLRRP